MKHRICAVAVLCIMTALLEGCGYHIAGRASQLPPSVHTIAIPVFINTTQGYRIEQLLTRAVVREFITRTNYRIVNKQIEADAILNGEVNSVQIAPVTYDSKTGRASTALVTIGMKVSLTDRGGRVLFQNQTYSFRSQYQISRELSSFFEEESPAIVRVSRDFAATLVSNILEAF